MCLIKSIILSIILMAPQAYTAQDDCVPQLKYYVSDDYVIVVRHPPTSPVIWEFEDDEWVAKPNPNADKLIHYDGWIYSHQYSIEIISQRDFLMRMIKHWRRPYTYWDFALLAYHWNNDGRFTLEAAADILSGVWLRNDYAN
jgi:hypothetical protein